MTRRLRRCVPLVALALICAAPVASAHPPRPDSKTQSLEDGCQRNPEGLLTFTSPEWVYIYKNPQPRLVKGIARFSHTAGGDLPEGHTWYDLNSNITVSRRFRYLLATANFTGEGEEMGRLHVEWETGSAPNFVWPDEYDHVKLWGSWNWDCGHWGESFEDPDFFLPGVGEPPGDSDVPGEHSEFHPMRAMVVTRHSPWRPRLRRTETDVNISTEGNLAHAEEQCALENPPPTGSDTYGPDYSACMNDPSSRHQQVNDRNYSFFVKAPARPNRSARLKYRVVNRATKAKSPPQRITKKRNGIRVTIRFKGFGNDQERLAYAKSFFVGWAHDHTRRPRRVKLTFDTLTVHNSLDPNPDQPFQSGTPPGEYNLYLNVNGRWKFLNRWAPGLLQVVDGQSFELNHSLKIYVPRGRGVRVFVQGRECDLPKIKPCPETPELAADNDLPGDAIDHFRSVRSSIGKHTVKADTGNFELTYSVHRLRR